MSTYTPIATQTLGSAAATITFSSLPQNYTDLIVVYNATSSTDDQNYLQFNGDTGSNYSRTFMTGNGSSAVSSRSSSDTRIFGPFSLSVPTVNIIQIQNYSNSATNKTTLIRSGAANNSTIATVGLWRSTAPITSILIGTNSGTFNTGTVFTIYGIAAGNSSAKATGGNIVTTDGSYWYHTFTSSGTFIPSTALTVDYLVVAGGGGGGGTSADASGGGGAGGLRSSVAPTGGGGSAESQLSLSANTVYQAIVGAGGAGGTGSAPAGNGKNGNNSIFGTITSIGGGGGAGGSVGGVGSVGSNGGSGGGGVIASGGSGTANQGYAGAGSAGNYGSGGGAGGLGAVTGFSGGNTSGTGVTNSISGTATNYAGGGNAGGSRSNSYGGGSGEYPLASNNATNGTAYTGGGGGGRWNGNAGPFTGGSGGSGIIIIRYAV